MEKVVVLDYGSSNLRSVTRALEAVANRSQQIVIGSTAETILQADRIVFPGQGAMGQCMKKLQEQELDQAIHTCLKTKPFLGLCLGLQSLMEYSSEDGGIEGLGVIAGQVERFAASHRDENGDLFKIPAMGWNQVRQTTAHPLWQNIADGCRFYFVHSYYVKPVLETDIAATTSYICEYASAVARDNLFATQFHPEKSQQAGLTLLKNFLSWSGQA